MSLFDTDKPVIILGHGVRNSGAEHLVPKIMALGVPVLTAWQGADLVDSSADMFFGRPGVYGQRCANKVLAGADRIVAIGCRLSQWTVGYDFPRRGQEVVMVDVDGAEVRRIRGARWIEEDAKLFMQSDLIVGDCGEWVSQCQIWRARYPWLEAAHNHANGYINPHRFVSLLQPHLKPDAVITVDCGTSNCVAHQILQLKPPQRLMTSGGLGEMGCGLPAAIGASFARDKGEVICLNNDGGMMLNLQELQTVAHHRLPIKLVVFSNDGYNMIYRSQEALGMAHVGVNPDSGVSCPNFVSVARAFGIDAMICNNPAEDIALLMAHDGPMLLEVRIDPKYDYAPKVATIRVDGQVTSAPFDQMHPEMA